MKKITQKPFPKAPGVYLFKDESGHIIYTGKAKCLQKRVQSYFSKQKTDWKVKALIDESVDIEYIVTKNETEALLLEAQLIHDQKPKFNVLLKEGQPFVYILFPAARGDVLPTVELVRNKKKKGKYFGPFLQKMQARSAFRYLITTFRLHLCNKKMKNGCLDFHIGLCAGNCKKDFDRPAYLFRLQLAQDALKNNHKVLLESLQNQIVKYNTNLEFEKAMHLQEYVENLDVILHTLRTKFSETKYQDSIFKKTAPVDLQKIPQEHISEEFQEFLGLDKPIQKIDCFDISHFQSNSIVGSCVRFTNGRPTKNSFRKFKIRTLTKQDDYAALQEVVSRRYKSYLSQDGGADCDLPDLVLVDGGKGQLHAVQKIIPYIPCISLAKREERMFGPGFPDGVVLDVKTSIGKLLIALRDYAHHFAINYHRARRNAQYR